MRAYLLEISHPGAGLQLIDLIEPRNIVSLLTDGTMVFYAPGGPPRPEVLIFSLGTKAGWFTSQGELTLEHEELRPHPPEVDGERIEKGQLADGQRLRWHDFTVRVRLATKPTQAEWAMIDAARTSDAALLVYADWLESSGQTEQAEWARLCLQDSPAAKARMAELSNRVGVDFRARVARGPVERCRHQCNQRWEELALLNEPWVRSCHKCSSSVRWCADAATGRARGSAPVAIDPVAPRAPGDLRPPLMPVG